MSKEVGLIQPFETMALNRPSTINYCPMDKFEDTNQCKIKFHTDQYFRYHELNNSESVDGQKRPSSLVMLFACIS